MKESAGFPREVHLLVAGLALLPGCTPGDSAPARVTVRDSMGVEIVESSAPLWEEAPAWTLSERPLVEIGAVEGERPYMLSSVWSARRSSDGRIAIANAGTDEIRVYDADGNHLRSIGREGEGPGDFQFVREVWWTPGDSLLAFDLRLRRAALFTSDGEVGRTVPVMPWSPEVSGPWIRGRFDDGTLIVSGEVRSGLPGPGLFDGGRRAFGRATAEGQFLNPIGEKALGRLWGFTTDRGTAYTSAPFELGVPAFAADGSRVFLGDGTGFAVEERNPDGTLTRIVRWTALRRPVTPEVVSRFREERLANARTPEERRSEEQILEGMPFPDVMPAYQTFQIDGLGHLWVERYRAPWEEDVRYWVFDPAGSWLGEIAMPAGVEPREIGADYLLGVRRDENGVEFIVLYGLDRPEG